MVAETKQNEAWATHAVEGIDLLNAAHRARVGVERDRLNPHGFLKRHFFCRVRWGACIQSNRARSPLRPINYPPSHAKSRTQERKVWPTIRMGNLETHVFSGKTTQPRTRKPEDS